MEKPRCLVVISFSFSIRYIYRTGLLNELRKFCIPVIIITWRQDDFIEELKNDGYEIYLVEQVKPTDKYENTRRKIDIYFEKYSLKGISKRIENSYVDSFKPKTVTYFKRLVRNYNLLKFKIPGYTENIFKYERNLIFSDDRFKKIAEFIKSLNLKYAFTVTPFHKQEDYILRACKYIGLKMITSILSFDNITKRGWMPVEYDIYIVWNKYNQQELQRAYSIHPEKIKISGAPQFDFYNNPLFFWSKEEWMQKLGMHKTHKKIILYSGGPSSVLKYEYQYVMEIANAIKNKRIANAIIIFRCHPIDQIERWKSILSNYNDVIIFEKTWAGNINLSQSNVSNEDIKMLCSTLAYTDVHISFCSTMTVDGSVFNKPQIAPYYDLVNFKNEKKLKKLYAQEHFLPIIKSKCLQLANSKEEFIEEINKALAGDKIPNSKKLLQEIITYTDGKSTKRVAQEIHSFFKIVGVE